MGSQRYTFGLNYENNILKSAKFFFANLLIFKELAKNNAFFDKYIHPFFQQNVCLNINFENLQISCFKIYFFKIKNMNKDSYSFFSENLIRWYKTHQRDLPWRNTRNPYFIWLSEIILQQTRVVQGLPYYEKFIENYPTVQDLASASEEDVLRLWQGLGYYSRARNLHTTAKMVVNDFGGVFPENYEGLLKLKGVGSYTAAAIASFAYSERVSVLDGNVFRVLARVFGEETDISANNAKKVFGDLAQSLLPEHDSDTHNQAIMEFGATQCTPGMPNCMFCPLSFECVANATGKQGVLPVKSKKVKVKHRFFNYFLIEQNQQILLRKRPERDVWAGMYDFYLKENQEKNIVELDLDELLTDDIFLQEIIQNSVVEQVSEIFTHVLTHQRIQTKFWRLKVNAEFLVNLPEGLQFYTLNEIDDLPKSTLVNNFLQAFVF
jgi:A/G-specific adenine glycosylase